MSWKQLREPNVAIKEEIGYCLRYVQRAFKANWAGPDAWTAWTQYVKHRHHDWNMPAGVASIVWFDGYWNGERYGHVAIYKDGKVYSSPYKAGQNYAVLNSIAVVESIYDMTFVGWSEDIGDITVIEEEDMAEKANLSTARILACAALARDGFDGRSNAHTGEADDDLIRNHVGQELTNEYIFKNFFGSEEAGKAFVIKESVYKERDALRKRVADLEMQIKNVAPASATGYEEVSEKLYRKK